jgi:hypothetical protein
VVEDARQRLLALGYLGGYNPAPEDCGITVYDAERAQPGLNLYVSGDVNAAYLMTMEGTSVHEWRYAFEDIWPDYEPPPPVLGLKRQAWTGGWRRVYMYDNGDLLAIYEGVGLIRLDRDSRLKWAYGGQCHHDLFVAEDGTIYVLTRQTRVIPRINESEPVLEDFITLLDPDGFVRKHISILECFENSPYAPVLDWVRPAGDIFHTNSVEILDGRFADRSPAFETGNVLISLRELDLVAVIDLEVQEVVFTLSGMWRKQHDPRLVDGGNILLFDNFGQEGRSKVIELDPLSQRIAWSFGVAPGEDLFSYTCGTCQRLPNGNTLITETDNGRAVEVTPDNEVVWEFVNPARAGSNRELIATIAEVVRVCDPEHLAWLDWH